MSSVVMAAGLACTAAFACGERVNLATHDGTQTPYSLAKPADGRPLRGVLVLLAGGDGHLKLDDRGCVHALGGNFLVRSAGLFREAGYATALVDVPSDHQGVDGLAGFRNAEAHAQDLSRIVSDLRSRMKAPVWVVGTSRGTISAANVASRVVGEGAPDGVVLSSVLSFGSRGLKPWTLQTVFDLPLGAVKVPAFVLGHAHDACLRSPPGEMPRVLRQLGSARKEMLTLAGGAAPERAAALAACEGRSPHGYFGQEAEAVGAIVRFIGGN